MDGSESMNVPKDFADMGGDIGDMGWDERMLRGDHSDLELMERCERILPPGNVGAGDFGSPWSDNGANILLLLAATDAACLDGDGCGGEVGSMMEIVKDEVGIMWAKVEMN